MKKLLFTVALLVFAIVATNAQSPTTVKQAKKPTPAEKKRMDEARKAAQTRGGAVNEAQVNNPNAPVIEFDKLVHNYGELEQHGDGKCEFKFTNNGKEPLILSNVRSSCGCTVPEWPRQPILPGQSEIIKVKYDTKRIGTINKSITVYSNATKKTVVLRIKGKVLSASSKLPEKHMDKKASPANK